MVKIRNTEYNLLVVDIVDILQFTNILLIVVTSLIILLDTSKPPEVTFALIMMVFIFQFFGILIYILTGINYKKNKIVRHLPEETYKNELDDIITEQKKLYRDLKLENEDTSDMVKAMSLLLNCSNSIVTLNNSVKLYHHGRELYKDIIKDLEQATESIHMEYFIWKSDRLGERIKDILIKKASTGIEVRLIFDGVGSFNRISLKYKRQLRRAGVKIIYFLDPLATPLKLLKFNYCNHRKIVVIDGHIGYTGGVNVGDEYLNGGELFDYWRDSHIRLNGDSVRMLQAIFLTDWYNSTNERLVERKYFPVSQRSHGFPMQLAVSGPDSKWSSIHQLYFSMITNANRKIYIQSPYFIPDASILKALETAALSGVDVHLMMTGKPDKRLPYWTAQTYFSSLLSAGVKIYLYKKGFLHSKVVIVDDLISTVGSCNMDIRSFHINYEVNAVMYDKQVSEQLKEQFFIDVYHSRLIDKSYIKKRNLFYKFRDAVCRLTSPLM